MTTTTHGTKVEAFLLAAKTLGLIVEQADASEMPSGYDGWIIKSEFTVQTGIGHALFVLIKDGPRGGTVSYFVQSTRGKTRKLRDKASARNWLHTLAV